MTDENGAADGNGSLPGLLVGQAETAVGAESSALFDFALDLGFRRFDGQRPSDEQQTLVWIDLLSTDPDPQLREVTRNWQGRGGEALVLVGTDEEPRPADDAGPLYRDSLHPREQLRALAFRGRQDRTLLDQYAEQPQQYAEDREESWFHFRQRLLLALPSSQQQNQDAPDRSAKRLFAAALRRLSAPGRLRDLRDLLLLLDAQDNQDQSTHLAPVLEAALCLQRMRHRWWQDGARVPALPLLLLRARPDEMESMDWMGRKALMEGARLYVPPTKPGSEPPLWLRTSGILEQGGTDYRRHFTGVWKLKTGPGRSDEHDYRVGNKALSKLLARLLVRGRPLQHYGCTLLFPFDPGAADQARFVAALPDARSRSDSNAPQPVHYGRDQTARDPESAQAQLYFLPHVQEFLYHAEGDGQRAASALEPIREWRLPPALVRRQSHPWRLQLELRPGDHAAQIVADVMSVRLLRYYNGIYLLALRVELPPAEAELESLRMDHDDWWHPLAFSGVDTFASVQERSLDRWLSFTHLARVLYPTFVEQHREGKLPTLRLLAGPESLACFEPAKAIRQAQAEDQANSGELPLPDRPGAALSPIVLELLARFFPAPLLGKLDLKSFLAERVDLQDGRLFVNVAYALAGPRLPESSGDGSGNAHDNAMIGDEQQLFALALYVDRFEDLSSANGGYLYDRDWLEQHLKPRSLGLWDALGTRAGYTDAANVYLGFGGYFGNIVAPRHVPYEYERMLVLALFYLATLRRFNRAIGKATEGLARPGHRRHFSLPREEFIAFTNRYWFREISWQMQGKLIFELQQQALGLKQEYDEIKEEIERADEYLAARREEREQRTTGRVGRIAFVLAMVGMLLAYLPLLRDAGGEKVTLYDLIFLGVPDASGLDLVPWLFGPLAVLVLVAMGLTLFLWLLYGGLSWLASAMPHRDKRRWSRWLPWRLFN
jgi:hypothetical protein